MRDIDSLIRDKYDGDTSIDLSADMERLAKGEPLAYVIGWIPFLGLRIALDSHPLIPRPETEWWTEELITHIQESKKEIRVLDLCAGSGAIGLAIQKHCPRAHVSFGEIEKEHVSLIRKNASLNTLSISENEIRASDMFEAFEGERFDIIATNPPYIPATRELQKEVTDYEPSKALFAGSDGLDSIRTILKEAPLHLTPGGEVWMECDIENIEQAALLASEAGATRTNVRNDLYGRPRILVAYY